MQGTGCAAISGKDGRWREVSCDAGLPSACYQDAGSWLVASGGRGACPQGSSMRVPAHAKENTALQAAVSAAGKDAAFLPPPRSTPHAPPCPAQFSILAVSCPQHQIIIITLSRHGDQCPFSSLTPCSPACLVPLLAVSGPQHQIIITSSRHANQCPSLLPHPWFPGLLSASAGSLMASASDHHHHQQAC